jgi:hypothetical protein
MRRRRTSLLVRAKTLPLVTVQTAAGVCWFVGFAVRNGHFTRPPGTLLAQCELWWFWVAMIGGFGVWSGCTLVRLVRLQTVFISTSAPRARTRGPSRTRTWPPGRRAAVLAPVARAPRRLPAALRCLLRRPSAQSRVCPIRTAASFAPERSPAASPRAVVYRADLQACLYASRAWVALDFVILLWVFALMLVLLFLLRNVRARAWCPRPMPCA